MHAYVLLCFVYLYIYKTPDTRVNNVEKNPAKVKSHNCIENMTHFFNETVNYDKALPIMGTQPTIRNLIEDYTVYARIFICVVKEQKSRNEVKPYYMYI